MFNYFLLTLAITDYIMLTLSFICAPLVRHLDKQSNLGPLSSVLFWSIQRTYVGSRCIFSIHVSPISGHYMVFHDQCKIAISFDLLLLGISKLKLVLSLFMSSLRSPYTSLNLKDK